MSDINAVDLKPVMRALEVLSVDDEFQGAEITKCLNTTRREYDRLLGDARCLVLRLADYRKALLECLHAFKTDPLSLNDGDDELSMLRSDLLAERGGQEQAERIRTGAVED